MNDTTLQQHYLEEQQQPPTPQQQHPDMPAPEAQGSHISDETEQSTPENPTVRPTCDGSTVEVLKRRRGRPRGSRNKAKTAVVVPSDVDRSLAALLPQILEVPSGYNVSELLPQLACARNLCVYVKSAVGAVADIVLRNLQIGGLPSQTPTGTPMRGKYDILTISGIFFPPTVSQTTSAYVGVISISLAGPQGQVVGGTVAGRLVAAGTVVLVVTMINPATQRLHLEGFTSMPDSQQINVFNQQGDHHLHGQQGPEPTPAVSVVMSNYNSLVVPDGLWAPTVFAPRPPRPGPSLFPF